MKDDSVRRAEVIDKEHVGIDVIEMAFLLLLFLLTAGVIWLGYTQYWQNRMLKAMAENAALQSELLLRKSAVPCTSDSSDVRTFEARR